MRRARDIELIYSEETEVDDYRDLIAGMERELPGRAFYAVVKDSELRMELMSERGAELVYEDAADGGNVYMLNPWFVG